MHPFCVIGEAGEYSRRTPLCPWRDESHIKYYVPVDNTQKAFEEFELRMNKWAAVPSGQVVMAHGEAGCGKTSLIHRCAYRCRERLQPEIRVGIVDLTSESWGSQAADDKVVSIIDATLYEVARIEGFLPAATAKQLKDGGAQSPHIRKELSQALITNNAVIILLLPQIETKAELDRFAASFSNPNFVVFLETASEDIGRYCKQTHGSSSRMPVLCLSVGPLSEDDGWDFVEKRLLIQPSENSVKFEQQSVRRFVRERASGGGPVSVLGLERLCFLLYQDLRGREDAVGYDDIAALFIRRGGIP